MLKAIIKSNWLVGVLIFFMPVLLILFLGSLMGYSQVKGKAEAYETIPEITDLSALKALPPGSIVMLRGQIAESSPRRSSDPIDPDLIVYQEQPAEDREIRFREDFGHVFSKFSMAVSSGEVIIIPSETRELVIQNGLHKIPDGDKVRAGFRIGDVVTVQGEWQPEPVPALVDVTGITSIDKQHFMAEWQSAFQKIGWLRNILGLLTLAGIILLIIEFRRAKTQQQREQEAWTTTTTMPTT
jgi:hypothetical protein